MTIEPKLRYWACVGPHGYLDHDSIRYSKPASIKRFIGDSTKPWRWWREKRGWRCVRVDITFKLSDST